MDYKSTINLPQTDFAMKADLAKREPGMLAAWERAHRYAEIQKRTAARKTLYLLHDGPPYANGVIHIGHAVNKILKDVVVKSKLLAGFRSPYVPGWDCHGLPIEIAVEKEIGKVGQKVDAATFRKKCREYAAKQIDLQRADFKRLGVLGEWDNPYRTMDFRYEADMIRALARIIANGHLLRGAKPVHWCFDCGSALAEAEIEYVDKISPAVDVAYDAVDPKALAARLGVSIGDDAIVSVPIWTTTPWTLPASLAVTLGAELEYVLVEAAARGGKRVLLVLAEALAGRVLQRYGVENAAILGRAKGSALESFSPLPAGAGSGTAGERNRAGSTLLKHPFYAREVPIILGEHVSAEEGTGAVHTAPGHGQEDFAVGQKYGIGVLNPVGYNGVYLPDTELFAGQHVWKANASIIAVLRENGVLLALDPQYRHSYPHCWRHKTPVAFRATPQWFISMDQAGLRARALAAIETEVNWFPAWGRERIAGMVSGRPDWCISRQRTWGVPIALFAHKSTGEPHPRTVELMEPIAQRVEQGGADVWYALEPRELIGDDAEHYERVTDILDVWFDSGVTHACVVQARDYLRPRPGSDDKVMYLEGSDQHRGWFQSSLLTAVGMYSRAPYNDVLTHGFAVDAAGRKMSKSLGNVVAPQQVMNTLGADILRLWVVSTDYRNEMSVSDEILRRVSDAYRRIRNTCRFLLGNLHGFDPEQHLVAVKDSLLLDQWAIQQAYDVQQQVLAAYARYDFPDIVQRIQNFCTNEMGALYLDITKDRLYTMQENSHGRRSAQSAMYRILESMVRWLAPILTFTAEEIWQHMPKSQHAPAADGGKEAYKPRDESVLFETWYEGLEALQDSPEQRKFWSDLLALRAASAKLLEGMRNSGKIGASLDATLELFVDDKFQKIFEPFKDELRFQFITSDFGLGDRTRRPAGDKVQAAWGGDQYAGEDKYGYFVQRPIDELSDFNAWVLARPSRDKKCVRCWHHRPDVGSRKEHPEICGRCIANLPDGPGEDRRWF